LHALVKTGAPLASRPALTGACLRTAARLMVSLRASRRGRLREHDDRTGQTGAPRYSPIQQVRPRRYRSAAASARPAARIGSMRG